MKKLCLVALVAIFSLTSVKAQEGFNVGVHIGLPVGNISNGSSLNFGADLSYLFEVADSFYAGIASGYTHFTGKTVSGFKVPSQGAIPISGNWSLWFF